MSGSESKVDQAVRYNEVVCIGAGIAGIAIGALLKRTYHRTDIHLYDRNDRFGGTWATNNYPGCACDIGTALYSYSFAQNAKWTRNFAPAEEIYEYLRSVAEAYDLPRKTTFRTEVTKAVWDDARARWHVYVNDLTTGQTYIHECKVLITAVGILANPNEPNIPGKETFEGAIFHSSKWDHSVSLEGKNVIVVGNGCTGAQIVPSIAPKVKHVTQFIRTNHWLLKIPPASALVYPPRLLWIFKHVPGALKLHRFRQFIGYEQVREMLVLTPEAAKKRAKLEEIQLRHLAATVPPEYVDILTPKFSIGCKRRVVDMGYYESLRSPNVDLKQEDILEILPDAVRTNKAVYPADVVVFATGFKTAKFLAPVEVYGKNGKELQEYWESQGGAGAYKCAAVTGFPNMFMLLGPNTLTGHTSAILAIERTAEYALRMLDPVLRGEISQVDVKPEAEKSYVQAVQRDNKKGVWNSGCSSWYQEAGGHNAYLYPWSSWWQMYELSFSKWSDWTIQYTPKGKKLATIRRVIRAVGLTSVVGLGIMSYYGVVPRNIGIRLRDIVKTANSTLIGNIRSLS